LFFSGTFSLEIKAHFCGDNLHSLSLNKNAKVNEEDCCGVVNDCCSDTETSVDVDQDFMSQDQKFEHSKMECLVSHNIHKFCSNDLLAEREIILGGSNSSPPPEGAPLYLLHRSILI